MITLTDCPRDLIIPFFLKLTNSVATLNVFQRVSKGFKDVVDDPEFLRFLLIKLKGCAFSDPIYTNAPKKFLYLDRDLTLSIQQKKKKPITSIVLSDLNLRVFILRMESKAYRYQLSEKTMDAWTKVDIADRKGWKKCIKNITAHISEVKIIGESIIGVPYLEKIQLGFSNPNKEMQNLIKDYKIKEVFCGTPFHLVIHHKSDMTGPVLHQMMNVNLNEEERMAVATALLLGDFLGKVSLVPRDGHFKFVGNPQKKQELIVKINALTKEQKAEFEQSFQEDGNKFLLGKFFPTIWPNNLKDLGEEKCQELFNRLLYTTFVKSIKYEPREKLDEYDFTFDPVMQKSILRRLKDPEDRFKEMMEIETAESTLNLFKNVIFCEAWGNPPFNNEQGYIWAGLRVHLRFLPIMSK